MLTGYNTDFKFQGKVYHCQTEDGGVNSPYVTSLLYLQGAILASRKTSYADILKADCLDEVVRALMMEQHKQMIRDLMHGKLDLNNAPHESTYTPSTATASVPAPAAPTPAGEKPAPPAQTPARADAKEKGLDDIILDFLAQEQRDREQKKSI
ncbi:MAG: hypothetical protein M0R70_14590 [Nitrospirae bacterium]|nr:hypothetical protein [Nitrospirota bacterium]